MPGGAEVSIAAPSSSARGRVARGFTALLFGQGIRVFGHVVLVPLFLYYWSASAYGEWLALASLTAYLSALDLGVNTAGANRLTQLYARGQLAAYSRYQASALGFYLALAVAGGALLGVAVWRLPVAEWLGLRTIPSGDAAIVAWLLGIQVLVAMPVGFLCAVYRTTGRLAWSAWLGNALTLAGFAVVPIVLGLGGGMKALAGSQLLPFVAVTVFVLWHGRRRWSALMPRPGAAELAAMRELMGPSLFFALMLLANAVALQGPVLLVATHLGGAAVAVFVSTRTLTSLIRQGVFTMNNSLWPHLTATEATGDLRQLRVIHRLLVTSSTALAVAFAAVLWHEGEAMIAVWTGGKLVADPWLLRILLVQVVLQAPWMASSVLPIAFNRPRTVALASAIGSGIGVATAALLIGTFGLAAVPVGLTLGEAVACYRFVPREACRLIGEDYGRFAARVWLMLAIAATFTFGVAWLADRVAVGPAPMRWLEVGGAALAASLLVAWTVGLTGAERALLVRESRASLGRRQIVGAAQRA